MKKMGTQKTKDILVLSVILILTIIAALQIPSLKMDSSVEVFIPENNGLKILNDEIQDEFGSSDALIMGVKTRFGSVLEPETLKVTDGITKELKEFPGVDEVISLTNMEYIEASPEGMEVGPILEGFSPEELELFRYRLEDWKEIYQGLLYSRDETLAAIMIRPDRNTGEEGKRAIYERMEELAARHTNEDLSFPMAGQPILKNEISRNMLSDVIFLVPVAAFLLILVLFISFRTPEGVIFPILSLGVSVIWVIGLISYLDLTFTLAGIIIPVFLLVIGSAYGIHIMAHFYQDISEAKAYIDYENLCRILKAGTKKIRLSVLLAGATTAAGFIAQLSSPLTPFKVFGLMSAVGICFSLLLTFFMIPAMIRLRFSGGIDPGKYTRVIDPDDDQTGSRVFTRIETAVWKGRIPALILTILLLGTAVLMIPRITVGTNMLDFFTDDFRMVKDTEIFNDDLNGTGSVTLVIQSPQRGGVLHPLFLGQLEKFETWLPEQAEHVTKVQTVVPGIKRMNKIMNYHRIPYETALEEEPELDFFSEGFFEDSADSFSVETTNTTDTFVDQNYDTEWSTAPNHEGAPFDEIPVDPEKYGFSSIRELEEMIAQYMILYSGSLNSMLNDPLEPDRMVVSIQLDLETSAVIKNVCREIEDYWDFYLEEGWSYEIAGNSTFALVLSDLVIKSQLISLGIALAIVWVIMIVLFRSFKTGSIGMIPVFFALSGIFIFMVISGFNLDIVTSILAAMAVGVGVDYAIHFMTAWRRELSAGNAFPLAAVYRTTGKAILTNALSVAFGFLSLLFSRFVPIRQVGLLFTAAMLFAGFSALIILPMVISLMKKPFKNINTTNNKENEEWIENCSTA